MNFFFENMKLIAALAGAALCRLGKNKEKTEESQHDRLGKEPLLEMSDCDFNDEFDPLVQAFSRVTNQLGPKVITNIFLDNGAEENVILSPVAMASQLTLLYEGSGGETRRQLAGVTLMPETGALEAMSELKDRYSCITRGRVTSSDAIFLDESFQPQPEYFKQVHATHTSMFKLNFAKQAELSRTIIDQWSETNTKFQGMQIPEESISSETSMVMYSAIHFTAKWAVKFEESHPGGFLLPNGKTKMVDMMEMETTLPNILSCVDFPSIPGCEEDPLVPSLINIPFEDPRLQITVILSNEQLPVGQILAMSSQWLPYWRYVSENNFSNLVLRLPKVDLTTQIDLTNALFGVGIHDAFDPFIANFTRISNDVGISASNIFQRNYLKWDLDGASAGGDNVLSLKLGARSGSVDSRDLNQFNVDRPFVFVISDRTTESNLFMGVLNDPRN